MLGSQVRVRIQCERERTLVVTIDDERGPQLNLKVFQKTVEPDNLLRCLAHRHTLQFRGREHYRPLLLGLPRVYPESETKDICTGGHTIVVIASPIRI